MTLTSTPKVDQQYRKQWESWHTQEDVPNHAISAPKLVDFLVHFFMIGLAWHTIGIHSAISAFLEPSSLSRCYTSSDHLSSNVSLLFTTASIM